MLRVQLTQKDFTTKQIEITVTDGAGNTSEKYVLQNPYYEWAKKQAEKQKTSSDSNGAMATTTSADATGTEKSTTSPLPQDAQASEPTDAKGTVDDRTVTGIEEQLNKDTRGGLEVAHIHCDDGLKLEVVVSLGRPGRQIFTQGSIDVSTGMA